MPISDTILRVAVMVLRGKGNAGLRPPRRRMPGRRRTRRPTGTPRAHPAGARPARRRRCDRSGGRSRAQRDAVDGKLAGLCQGRRRMIVGRARRRRQEGRCLLRRFQRIAEGLTVALDTAPLRAGRRRRVRSARAAWARWRRRRPPGGSGVPASIASPLVTQRTRGLRTTRHGAPGGSQQADVGGPSRRHAPSEGLPRAPWLPARSPRCPRSPAR